MTVEAVLFHATMFKVQDSPYADRMLILPDCGANDVDMPRPHIRLNLRLGQILFLLWQDKLVFVYGSIEDALDLKQTPLGWV